MAATGVQINWENAGFTPTSGTLVAIARVTSCQFSQGGETIDFAGDNNRYPSVIVQNVSRPSATVTSADTATLHSIVGEVGAFAATQLDALGAANGGVQWSLTNAVVSTSDAQGSWGQFGHGSAQFKAFAPDGTTNPLTLSRV